MPRGDFYNKDTKWTIKSNADGIDETSSKEHKWSDSYHSLADIDKMLTNAVLLDTVVVTEPSKRLGKNAVFMHHMYCPVIVDGTKGLAKLYVAETLGNTHKFYLTRIEKASTDMGFFSVPRESTPRSDATSADATVSIAQIFEFVKQHDKDYEAESSNPVYFEPKPVNPLFLNEDGTPKVFYHGSKKGGGFTVFRDWQYFTENKPYAKRYTERGNDKSLYAVYLRADKIFDTRNAEARKIFESIRSEYGLGELQDTGLPDWTDGYDISDYLDEHPELGYDAVLLDEGGDLINGKPVSRGLSIVIKDSAQIKSATDNIGTFDRNNPDIRYSRKSGRSAVYHAYEIMDLFGIKKTAENRDTVASTLEQIVNAARMGGEDVFNDEVSRDMAMKAAEFILPEVKKQRSERAQYILHEIRGTKVFIDEYQLQEIKNAYGNWQTFSRGLMGYIYPTQSREKADCSLDQMWQEWSEKYPDFFDKGVVGGDGSLRVCCFLTSMQCT
ncbi:MAG: hypothetical protein PUC29_00645 [Clostridia bacterium]|nr:hypothetical protein [Clostridia bacterium]